MQGLSTYMRPMPAPPADVVDRLPRIPTQLAWAAGIEHITENRDLWPLLTPTAQSPRPMA